ncbi:MAG: 30S ribosomal protein S18 [Chloroflexi bacterium]|nr:30S ribosomal protein S18 [Chloroflexota bacterium]
MSQGPGGSGGDGRPPRPQRPRGRYAPRRKVCQFCVEKLDYIDYKDLMRLRRFMSDRAKIEPSRRTGTCAKHQRRLSRALKRARHIALLPFSAEHIRTSGGMVMPVPGMPTVSERPFPPRDSFGPYGSQPGGNRGPAPQPVEAQVEAQVEAPEMPASED